MQVRGPQRRNRRGTPGTSEMQHRTRPGALCALFYSACLPCACVTGRSPRGCATQGLAGYTRTMCASTLGSSCFAGALYDDSFASFLVRHSRPPFSLSSWPGSSASRKTFHLAVRRRKAGVPGTESWCGSRRTPASKKQMRRTGNAHCCGPQPAGRVPVSEVSGVQQKLVGGPWSVFIGLYPPASLLQFRDGIPVLLSQPRRHLPIFLPWTLDGTVSAEITLCHRAVLPCLPSRDSITTEHAC